MVLALFVQVTRTAYEKLVDATFRIEAFVNSL